MGISGLSRVIADNAPGAVREQALGAFFGRRVAVDASMCIYQFLVAVRTEGAQLTNAAGETTSHLSGMFYRTVRMAEAGVRPVYVFDGAPPTLKSGELARRSDRRAEAEASLSAARESGDAAAADKYTRRLVKATRQHTDECKALLRLMGVPVVQAPCEAEAQCAALVRAGLAYAAGSEDMDTLTFGAPVLLRHLTYAESRKMPIAEITHADVLSGLGLTHDQFVDLCILLGCDYCDTIRGIGAVRALALIRQHGSIEGILDALGLEVPPPLDEAPPGDIGSSGATDEQKGDSAADCGSDDVQKGNNAAEPSDSENERGETNAGKEPADAGERGAKPKYRVPAGWPFKEARALFHAPAVLPSDDAQLAPDALRGGPADVEGVVAFLCGTHGFAEERVRAGLARLAKARAGATQSRLDAFFKVARPAPKAAQPPPKKAKAASKRGGKAH